MNGAGRTGGVEGVAMFLGDGPAADGSPWRPLTPFSMEPPHLLTGVAATAPDDVWVVGQAQGGPLALHWDGGSWSMPPGPAPSAAFIGAGLEGVAACRAQADGSGTTVLAVGGAYDRLLGAEVPLIRHWNGLGWEDVTAPALPGAPDTARDYVLTGVAMVGPAEAWAVGHGFGARAPLVVLHWHDGRWQAAEGPSGVPQGKLLAVSGTSPQDVWAVGATGREGLIAHFDGASWRRIPAPATRSPLTDVTAVAPDDVWCAGGGSVLHWNGRKWSRVKAPVESANTVAAFSSTDVWVGGARGDLAHYDGRRWTWVPAPDHLRDTAVWRASTTTNAHPGEPTVWMVGSRRFDKAATPARKGITAQHGEP
ncbi:hypothetical protein [Thermomonospora cellulosilytica]|uniref:Uncharacterized protein n=1 Tax=Thermomonospora cellulosilytica TaxID=1411118 RepID=A0A7W3R6Z6_9ACTN|nr:hypothetical protein [Thermomonospora cellulosilytica]MBA9002071.1 hypothetical protein [Thermomonospora cellulosilytica]